MKKETSLQKEATEISETTEITEAVVNTETQKTSDFYISKIPDDIFEKMQGKSYKADCTVLAGRASICSCPAYGI